MMRAAEVRFDHAVESERGPAFEGIKVGGLADLMAILDCLPVPQPRLFADLSLGSWEPNALANQFLRQLGTSAEANAGAQFLQSVRGSLAKFPSYADLIGIAVDTETLGERAPLRAATLARDLAVAAAAQGMSFVVLMPRFANAWERADILLLEFLVKAGQRVILVAAEPGCSPTPKGWEVQWRAERPAVTEPMVGGLLALVPGVVDAAVADELAKRDAARETRTLVLLNSMVLVAPEHRRARAQVSHLEFDRLGNTIAGADRLEPYAQCNGNSIYVDGALLAREAWRAFEAGAGELGRRLLERAANCAPSAIARSVFDVQYRAMQIAGSCFSELARQPDPSVDLPADVRRFLLLAKGWGLAMVDQADRAASYIEQARMLWSTVDERREYLYLLNILAFCDMARGDLSLALARENEIARDAEQVAAPDWRLRYINSINMARLHRRMGNLEAAASCYDTAFSTSLGTRAPNEAIYANVCQALIEGSRGNPRPALTAWVRAALHWLAMDVPEGLGRRVVRAILPGGNTTGDERVEAISAALLRQLEAAEKATRPAQRAFIAQRGIGNVQVALLQDHPELACHAAFGNDGWSVLAVNGTVTSGRSEGLTRRRLAHWLSAWMRYDAGVDDSSSNLLILDDRYGRETATTPSELIAVCIRRRIDTVIFGGRKISVPHDIAACLERDLVVTVGPGVAEMHLAKTPASATFKRHLPPRSLSTLEVLVLERVGDGGTLGQVIERCTVAGASRAVIETVIGTLEEARIIAVDGSQVICGKVGI